MALLTTITPNWLLRMAKGISSTRESRCAHYRLQISNLRELLWMLHDHNTRYIRCPQSPQASKARDEIRAFCDTMLTQSSNPQRPLFWVLTSRMEEVLQALPNQSKAGWFALHHRTSDHLIYIIDEVTRAYILELKEETMYDEYQAFWQTWIDTKEAQLRFEQAAMRLMDGKVTAWQSVNLQSRILQKRMYQLSLMSSTDASLAFERIEHRFDSVIRAEDEAQIPASSLVKISQDLSVILLHLFDRELEVKTQRNAAPVTQLQRALPSRVS